MKITIHRALLARAVASLASAGCDDPSTGKSKATTGDAVTTTKQESLLAVATQRIAVHGPPAYFTVDWDAARESAWHLASLLPEVLATGHGVPLRGAVMRHALHMMAAHFDRSERPKFGRYARTPAVMDADGTYDLPRDP